MHDLGIAHGNLRMVRPPSILNIHVTQLTLALYFRQAPWSAMMALSGSEASVVRLLFPTPRLRQWRVGLAPMDFLVVVRRG